jgi:TatD DNase family protein
MIWFDTHTHLNDSAFDPDLTEVLLRMDLAGVKRAIVVGYDLDSSVKAVELARQHAAIYAAVGIHPHDARDYSDTVEDKLRQLLADDKTVAVGEIGLDYHYDYSPRPVQQETFRRQLRLAKELGYPVTIHSREATSETMLILQEEQVETVGGVMHCFSGSPETAEEVMDLGLYISIAGPITFANARRLPEVITTVGTERLLIETDCPYLTPRPHRGERNEPSYVPLVGREVAQILQLSAEKLADVTTRNASRLFGLNTERNG